MLTTPTNPAATPAQSPAEGYGPTDAELEALARQHGTGGWQTLSDMVRFARAVLASQPQPKAHGDKWEGAEEWMPLAWELCANECGEEACTELIWEGGPIPEPWGDRWLKYEDQAKEMIAMVRKHVRPQPDVQPKGLTSVCHMECDGCIDSGKCAHAEVQAAAQPEHLSDARKLYFIKGWDARGMAHGLRGSAETDRAMREHMSGVFAPPQAPQAPAPAQTAGCAQHTMRGYCMACERWISYQEADQAPAVGDARKDFEAWTVSFYAGLANAADTWDEQRKTYTDYAHHMAWCLWRYFAAQATAPAPQPERLIVHRDALTLAADVLTCATSFNSKKARDAHLGALEGLIDALAQHRHSLSRSTPTAVAHQHPEN